MRDVAVVLDLYSRFVVDSAISAVDNRHLTIKSAMVTATRIMDYLVQPFNLWWA